jgi:plastocyanin
MRFAACVLAALGALGSCAAIFPAPAGQPTQHTVTIEGLQFTPAMLTVHRGEQIVWVNKDPLPHTVTAAGKAFDSGTIAANASWSYIANKPGEYAYACIFHPTMKAKVTVR